MTDWDERYRTAATPEALVPSIFLVETLDRLPLGRALDVAMGQGRNAYFLAEHGFQVDGVDRSLVAVEQVATEARRRGLPINAIAMDLESDPLPSGPYHLVLVFNYLQRSLFPALSGVLAPGGVLIFETYTTEHGGHSPCNPAFLLQPGELRGAFPTLQLLHYREAKGKASLAAYRKQDEIPRNAQATRSATASAPVGPRASRPPAPLANHDSP